LTTESSYRPAMADSWQREGTVDCFVEASPEAVYAVVADVTSTGERSPECKTADWLPGAASGTVGARFRGRNRVGRLIRWSRVCEILEADPGRRFAFRTVPERIDRSRHDSTTWRYRLEAQGTGTLITHSYEITMLPGPFFRAIYGRLLPHHKDMRPQMAETLANLKRSMEPAGIS
jgi:hypothetical protein